MRQFSPRKRRGLDGIQWAHLNSLNKTVRICAAAHPQENMVEDNHTQKKGWLDHHTKYKHIYTQLGTIGISHYRHPQIYAICNNIALELHFTMLLDLYKLIKFNVTISFFKPFLNMI